MTKAIAILGSTGSIGCQTLEVAEFLNIKVKAISADKNIDLLEKQIRKFDPELVAVYDETAANNLKSRVKRVKDINVRIVQGMEGLIEVAQISGTDVIVTAIAGQAGLKPTLAALETGKRIALANKEPLVCAGELVMQTAIKHGAEIIPVDSEHSAIFQCLPHPINHANIRRLILTASGGPFRGKSRKELEKITPEQALSHPNWTMGKKITIDSATLMNKGLELIEAMHLFGMNPDQIDVMIHPESIIHSMVEFNDGSTIAQLSNPDMRQPIQYALTYPDRLPSLTKPLDLIQLGKLTFEKPDTDTFPCLRLAYEAAKTSEKACAVLNRANEEAVGLFLDGKITFNGISEFIEKALKLAQA
ncbi:MAG: 1-deoxy-D-xylulose-5-phosphate reductoisomerase [Oscillospiraceae bacterium]|nr:1-deoxy-D-xylulose-5-phosphate reductoisomerase [Oscillospiraceae bacterium]